MFADVEVTLECIKHGNRDRLWFGDGSPNSPLSGLFADELAKAWLLVLDGAGVVIRARNACQHGQAGTG